MESRNIALTLEKAREWYNSGSSDLKEVALQAYTEQELTTPKFTDIKNFWDAVNALNLDKGNIKFDLNILEGLESNLSKHLAAVYKLDIIRKALNGDWNPKIAMDSICYPHITFYPSGSEARGAAIMNGWKIGKTFIADREEYTLICGDYCHPCGSGMSRFCVGFGDITFDEGLLCCKSKEIAEHMSLYFAKEIFEACYAQHFGAYEWV